MKHEQKILVDDFGCSNNLSDLSDIHKKNRTPKRNIIDKRKIKSFRVFDLDKILGLIVALFFIIFSVSLPIYDDKNGLYNPIFDDYNLVWYDGRSPANFYLIRNRVLSIPLGTTIGDVPIEFLFDFIKIGNTYRPIYNILPEVLFMPLSFLTLSELQLFKLLIILNIGLYSIVLFLFYLLQRSLGLRRGYSTISSFVAGIATSILIYSRYLFLQGTFITLASILLILMIFKREKNLKKDLSISITLLLFSIFFYVQLVPIFLSFFLFLFYKYEIIDSFKIFLIFVVLSIFLSAIFPYLLGQFVIVPASNSFRLKIFQNYIPAMEYSIYGFYNISDRWKYERSYAYVYGFKQGRGNALFLFSHGLFQSLFGPKGFVFNSPFLIFSIFGILSYRKKEERNILTSIILLFIIVFGLFWPGWYGGVTPRYVRYFNIPILLLTFFSFYYVQQLRDKWKMRGIKTLFVVLVILSALNVSSLAIRADWTYEHPADLVSYDLVLWPWYPPKEGLTIYLTEKGEQIKWLLSGEASCRATVTNEGIVTDPCDCKYNSWAEREINIRRSASKVEVEACTGIAGNDGTKGLIFMDKKLLGELFIKSNSCSKKTFFHELSPGNHIIMLKSGKYGNCNGEMIFWKSVKLE